MSYTLRNCLVSLLCLSLLLGIGCQREGDQENGGAMNWEKTSKNRLKNERGKRGEFVPTRGGAISNSGGGGWVVVVESKKRNRCLEGVAEKTCFLKTH